MDGVQSQSPPNLAKQMVVDPAPEAAAMRGQHFPDNFVLRHKHHKIAHKPCYTRHSKYLKYLSNIQRERIAITVDLHQGAP
jgi:hypothetical protein